MHQSTRKCLHEIKLFSIIDWKYTLIRTLTSLTSVEKLNGFNMTSDRHSCIRTSFLVSSPRAATPFTTPILPGLAVALAFDALVSAGGGVRYRWVLRYARRDPIPSPGQLALAPPAQKSYDEHKTMQAAAAT